MSRLVIVRSGKSHGTDYFGGHEISTGAIVTEEGVVGAYEIVLFSRLSLKAIARVVSAADGSYRFQYLSNTAAEGYILVAFDSGASPTSPAISDTPILTAMGFNF